jgi:hypothetical protein
VADKTGISWTDATWSGPAVLHHQHVDQLLLDLAPRRRHPLVEVTVPLAAVAWAARRYDVARFGLSSTRHRDQVIVGRRRSIAVRAQPAELLGQVLLRGRRHRRNTALALRRSVSTAPLVVLVGGVPVTIFGRRVLAARTSGDVSARQPGCASATPRVARGAAHPPFARRRSRRRSVRPAVNARRRETVVSRAVTNERSANAPAATAVAPLLSGRMSRGQFCDGHSSLACEHSHRTVVCLRHVSIVSEQRHG